VVFNEPRGKCVKDDASGSSMHKLVVEQGEYIFVCWIDSISIHVLLLMPEGRCLMVVVASKNRDRRGSWSRPFIWTLTHQMPPIPSWLRHGRRTEYLGFSFLLFSRVFGAHLFREARSRKEIRALNAEVTGRTPF
jgi:hypothetical protein